MNAGRPLSIADSDAPAVRVCSPFLYGWDLRVARMTLEASPRLSARTRTPS